MGQASIIYVSGDTTILTNIQSNGELMAREYLFH